jgi:hypothetical protein
MGKATNILIGHADQIVIYDAYYLMMKRATVGTLLAPFTVVADEIVEYAAQASVA